MGIGLRARGNGKSSEVKLESLEAGVWAGRLAFGTRLSGWS
jgi:hypothetical protein